LDCDPFVFFALLGAVDGFDTLVDDSGLVPFPVAGGCAVPSVILGRDAPSAPELVRALPFSVLDLKQVVSLTDDVVVCSVVEDSAVAVAAFSSLAVAVVLVMVLSSTTAASPPLIESKKLPIPTPILPAVSLVQISISMLDNSDPIYSALFPLTTMARA